MRPWSFLYTCRSMTYLAARLAIWPQLQRPMRSIIVQLLFLLATVVANGVKARIETCSG